jgi:hypothetical protein
MPNYVVDSADLEVALRAAAYGGREERLRLWRIADVLNGGEGTERALTNLGNPEPAARNTAYDNLSEAATAA